MPQGARPHHRIQTALSRIVDNAGQVIGVVGVARDVTARVEFEEARVEMERRTMALQKAESLAALAGGVAHDFNNLLSGVLLNAELAAGEVGPTSRARVLIDDLVSAAESASGLSRQMLAYSGGGRIIVERIEPGELLRSMRSSLATRLGADATFHLDIADALPAIQADATQVWQAVYNLVLNASDALHDGTGDISVVVGVVDRHDIPTHLAGYRTYLNGEAFVEFRVVDSGEGIPAEIAERLFEPFFTTRFAGRGMGLSAVLGITRVHGGAILFEPGSDAGAAFHLYLPALEEEGAEPPVESVCEPERPAPMVLIVDDEAIVRRAGRRLLEALGYRVLEAEDGDVALEIWQANRSDVDLVILDMTMPRLDGCDTLAQLRQWAPDLKVLMTSGYSEREVLARSRDHTPNGFVPKPFRLQQVQESIEHVLAIPAG
jgi:signal transduction histidine kinase/CheY-like chemotaxis protein